MRYVVLFFVLCSVRFAAAFTLTAGLVVDIHINSTNPAAGQGYGDDFPIGSLFGWRIKANGDDSLPLAVTQWNISNVDIAVQLGDAIDGGTVGAVRNANYTQFVEIIDGTAASNAALDTGTLAAGEIYGCLGHWGAGLLTPDAADYAAYFHNDGMGTVIPAGANAPAKQWWPAVAADDSACSYVIETTDFYLIFLTAMLDSCGLDTAGQSDDTGGGDNEVITQLAWLEVMLDEAQAASEPVIIFSHQPLRTLDSGVGVDTTGKISGFADGLTLIEGAGYTIPIYVVAGHIHRDQSIITNTGITHINLGGDVWGNLATDTGRFSYAVLEITAPTYNTPDGNMGLVTLTGYGLQRSEDLSKVLVGYWKLNETDGTAAAGDAILDSSGNAYHGTNSETVVSVASPIAHGVTLDGTGDYITASDEMLVDYPFSFSLWVKSPVTVSAQATLFSIAQKAVENRYITIDLRTDGLLEYIVRVAGTQGASTLVVLGTPINDTEWHLVTTVSATTAVHKVYVDGKLITTSPVTITKAWDSGTTPMTDWTIGRRELATPDQLFAGSISDVRVYSGALSANDVAKLYKGGTATMGRRFNTKKNTGLSRTRGRF